MYFGIKSVQEKQGTLCCLQGVKDAQGQSGQLLLVKERTIYDLEMGLLATEDCDYYLGVTLFVIIILG